MVEWKSACGILFAPTLLCGCVLRESYGDPALPQGQRAVVEGYWHYRVLYDEELHIISVDGRPQGGSHGWPYAYSVSLPAGAHWIELAVLRNSKDITRCAFGSHFEAGHHYKLRRLEHDPFLLAHAASPNFAASVSILDTAADVADRHASVPAVCGAQPRCRSSSDCPSESSCQREGDAEFGACVSIAPQSRQPGPG